MAIFRKTSSCLLVAVGLLAGSAFAADPLGADELLTIPTSKENVVAGLTADAYQTGLSAYIWGYPLVRMERVARDYTDVPDPKPATSYRAPLNQIGWATSLATPDAKDMPTANNDTFYMSAVVDLGKEPFVLHVPDTNDRYYVVDVFDMWQNLQHYIGRRTTGTKAEDYALVPPGWQGELPAGVTRLDVNTSKVWLWGRLRVSQGEPMEPLMALQKEFSLRPISQMANADYKPETTSLPPLPEMGNDPLDFYRQLAAALKDNDVPARDAALFGQFARFGLTKAGFDDSKLLPQQKEALIRALQDGPKVAVSALASAAVERNGWSWATGLDNFGDMYPLRALVAGPYLGGQGEKEAMYPLRSADSKGEQLVGSKNYVIRFAKAPPVNAFWSLTVYNASDKMLIENPIHRYKLGSDTKGFFTRADGSFEVPLQHEKPTGEFAGNWLPTPSGPYYMILRLYQPTDEVLSGNYALPQVDPAP
ncbi:DUF1254 domain-containing protein [Rhizobium leguminosarum]|uniref:DUF1254 domain-containing protein n=2 Tax=Rhizobium leguminosarum TaxID=384 RepID=A0A154IN74_RHILE|nr:DUF1254 domain-containing protein [Rhizobium leguminosarum]KZB01876.1 hypothetical protein A4A59_12680 [Rhizobium leguminosarum]